MNFRSAKNQLKIRHLGSEAGKSENTGQDRRVGVRGRGLESDRTGGEVRHARNPVAKAPGAADPNAPSGASTAAPYFGARRSLQLVAFCMQAALAIFKSCCKKRVWNVSKMMAKYFKFHQKSTTMHQKSTKMTSGTLRVGSWKHVGFRNVKMSHRLMLFRGPLAPLERFWALFGAQLGAKRGPKSHFSGKIPEKMRKNEVREPFRKKHEKT